MKLYARRGFEWAEDGLVGLWSPVSTGGTQGMLLDCNPSTSDHGTLTNYSNINTAWIGSQYGTVLNFDNTNDRIDFSVLSALNTGDVTFAFWYYPFSISGFSSIFNNWSTTISNVGFFCFRDGTAILFQQPTLSNRITTGPVLTVNRWHHIVCRKQSIVGGLRVFVNGVIDASSASPAGNQASTAVFNLCGNYGSVGAGNCQIAEFAIWNRAIANAEVSELFRLGPGGMWQERPRRSRAYFGAAGFKAYWARQQSTIIGGGVR